MGILFLAKGIVVFFTIQCPKCERVDKLLECSDKVKHNSVRGG